MQNHKIWEDYYGLRIQTNFGLLFWILHQICFYLLNIFLVYSATEHLIRHHEARGDKTLVFSDNIFALLSFARILNVKW